MEPVFGTGNPYSHSLISVKRGIILEIALFRWKDSVDLWSRGTLKSLVVPGGILLLAAVVLISGVFASVSAAGVDYYTTRFLEQERCLPCDSAPVEFYWL